MNTANIKDSLTIRCTPPTTASSTTVTTTPPNSLTQHGFTLVEIMVVVVILSIFAGMISLSVGSSEVRKNRAYYEYWLDSMDYIRLLSAERMQPMGIRLVLDKQGKMVAQVVRLDNAYASYQQSAQPLRPTNDDRTKNAMELSAEIRTGVDSQNPSVESPVWNVEQAVSFPDIPPDVQIDIQSLQQTAQPNQQTQQQLQPWFVGEDVPKMIWYGTGQATAVNIEIKYKGRLVGDSIQLLPDGSIKVGS